MSEKEEIRVRIAPSPTGFLHLGTLRTAFFNYLFAKKEGGKFIIRIEDTDKGRSLPVYETDILEGLKKIGVVWDEGPDIGGPYGPYRQSERTDVYRPYIEELIKDHKAYHCFCTKEELEADRQAMLSQGLAPKYSGTCKNLSADEVARRIAEGKDSVIRLVVPSDYVIEFNDLIRGKISVHANTIGDIVIAKKLDEPLYNFAVVIDDFLMRISHVIRGEDHISNTPKQLMILRALGMPEPKYAHLPLILAPDRSKLSKRSLETSFSEYLKEGYLPQAVLNFLVLLGWHPEGDEEILSLDQMVEQFSIKRIQKAGAVFSVEKLEWLNAQYIKKLSSAEAQEALREYVPAEWCAVPELLTRAFEIERERLKKLSEFAAHIDFIFTSPQVEPALLQWQTTPLDKISNNLSVMRSAIAAAQEWGSIEALENTLMPVADEIGRGEVLWPLRVALSGKKSSPGPFEILWVLGKDASLARIDAALSTLNSTHA